MSKTVTDENPELLDSMARNAKQDEVLAYHAKHIKALWSHLQRLERAINVDESLGMVTVGRDDAWIKFFGNGTMMISGNDIEMRGFKRIRIDSINMTINNSKV